MKKQRERKINKEKQRKQKGEKGKKCEKGKRGIIKELGLVKLTRVSSKRLSCSSYLLT